MIGCGCLNTSKNMRSSFCESSEVIVNDGNAMVVDPFSVWIKWPGFQEKALDEIREFDNPGTWGQLCSVNNLPHLVVAVIFPDCKGHLC